VNYNIADPEWPKIVEELNKQLGSAMYGEQTASEALDNTAAEAEKIRSR
jgi:multiple sugar transport system substrate-binding protein